MPKPPKTKSPPRSNWTGLTIATLLAAFAYALLEWLFMVTKPSALNTLGFGKKLEILLLFASLIASAGLLLLGAAYALSVLFKSRQSQKVLFALSAYIPAFITAALSLLLIDNFTYTLFKFGIVSTTGFLRGLYALLFLSLALYFHRFVLRRVKPAQPVKGQSPASRALYLGSLALVIAPIAILAVHQGTRFNLGGFKSAGTAKLPNILWITSDGLNAANMSLYGYARATTPFLDELAGSSLVAENAFTNSGNTSGSIVSFLTGKYPTTTRVLYPPDILHGEDTYEHLPAILKANGYTTVQIGHPYFVDAHSRNMLGAFDLTNGVNTSNDMLSRLAHTFSHDFAYFVYETGNRLADRLRHIFYLKTMVNPIDLVETPIEDLVDEEKFTALQKQLASNSQPLFVHLHYMGTHGSRFYPTQQVFSAGQDVNSQAAWSVDFYDDSILQFDGFIMRIVAELRAKGLFDETILIVGSDHAEKYVSTEPIPLLIHFPGGAEAGRIKANVQNLDITPTLLDYLEIAQPAWMPGVSLLQGEPPQRPIFSVDSAGKVIESNNTWLLDPAALQPPFYNLGHISVVYCQNWYQINLINYEWAEGEVPGSTVRCAASDLPTRAQVTGWIGEHFEANGWDAAELK